MRYGCTLYYDAELECYYYWCAPDSCYYPVSYCPYQRYGWTTVGEVHDGPDNRQAQADLDAFEASLR